MKNIKIYTDGACKGNPGKGGWGYIIYFPSGSTKKSNGMVNNTTNNKMELTAAIKAIKSLTSQSVGTVYTDSKYVKLGITQWIHGWIKKGWPDRIKNKEFWKELHFLNNKHILNWKWVKGHSNNKGNVIADKLATEAIINKR